MTLYESDGAAALRLAQELLDEHAVGLNGCCVRCGGDGRDCAQRRAALAVFTEYGCLPRRVPGGSRSHLRRVGVPRPNQRRAGGFGGWLD